MRATSYQSFLPVTINLDDFIMPLTSQVKEIQNQLEKLIWQDFREVFGSGGPKSLSHAPSQRIAEACLVLSVLDARVRYG